MSILRIALAQQHFIVGDFVGNAERILQAAQTAYTNGANLLLTPELSLCGYPPEDLLLCSAFLSACDQALQQLTQRLAAFPGLYVLIGHPAVMQGDVYNRATMVCDGVSQGFYDKQCLPNDSVFDERRYFQSGTQAFVLTIKDCKMAVLICEDVWHPEPSAQALVLGAQLILVINASPYHIGKQTEREMIVRQRVIETGIPYLYCNSVGAQDELVFDGTSFMINQQGEVIQRLPMFVEEIAYFEHDAAGHLCSPNTQKLHIVNPLPVDEAQIYTALKFGLRAYVDKNQFSGVVLGLSGGVDSALVLAIACDALGADKVHAVMMPSRYTADISLIDAQTMAKNLDVHYEVITITPIIEALTDSLSQQFSGYAIDTTEENIQARVRGTLLMALANKYHYLVLTTGNKSELAVGYCTLYGDMAGGFAVIKDVLKTWVYRLCIWRNAQSEIIPQRILTRAPSAELKPNQTDQDSLPPYDVLDTILVGYIEKNYSPAELIDQGHARSIVERVVYLIKSSEHKRYQCAVGTRITARAFGRDWRYPISQKFND